MLSKFVFATSLLKLLISVPLAEGAELLVFDWNMPVTKAEHGFPWDDPPMSSANGDWTTPDDYANGTLHYRVEIRSQPVAQDMKLQFCFWQQTPSRENCGPLQQVTGTPGATATWSCDVDSMWKKDGLPIEWTLPRQRNGVAIKDINGQPVSDYAGWNWNGHDPDQWYPLDMRFTVVVVSQGSTFSGWAGYVGGGTIPDLGLADAPSSPVDASSPPVDASSPPTDASSPPTDASSPPTDASSSPVDASSPPTDASSSEPGGNTLAGGGGCGVAGGPRERGDVCLALLTLALVLTIRRKRRRRALRDCPGSRPILRRPRLPSTSTSRCHCSERPLPLEHRPTATYPRTLMPSPQAPPPPRRAAWGTARGSQPGQRTAG